MITLKHLIITLAWMPFWVKITAGLFVCAIGLIAWYYFWDKNDRNRRV